MSESYSNTGLNFHFANTCGNRSVLVAMGARGDYPFGACVILDDVADLSSHCFDLVGYYKML